MGCFTSFLLLIAFNICIIVNANIMWRKQSSVANCDCGITSGSSESYFTHPTVLNGHKVEKGEELPWMVAIKYQGKLHCSGAMITRSFVLTAAHCVHGMPVSGHQHCQKPLKKISPGRCLNLKDIKIAFINKDGVLRKWYSVRDVLLHPDYQILTSSRGEYGKNDIALIRMPGAISCKKYRRPVCLPYNKSFVQPNRRAVIAGWGETSSESTIMNFTSYKKERDPTYGMVQIQPSSVCSASFPEEKSDTTFCAKGKQSACRGDSGAPLVADSDKRFYVIGVTSHLSSPKCKVNEPQFFVYVKHYLKWILDIVVCCP